MSTIMYQEIMSQNADLRQVLEYYKPLAKELLSQIKIFKRVYLMGTGASLQVCHSSVPAFLLHTKLDVIVIAACENLKMTRITTDDLVILVSQSGNSLETKVAIDYLLNRHIEVWGICNNDHSYLSSNAAKVLPIFAENETGSATKSYACSVLILNLIAIGDMALDISNIINDNKETLKISSQQAKDYCESIGDYDVLYIAGIGEAGPVASQASIVLKEKAYLHVSGMPISEFRHGTVEVVTQGLPIILVALDKQDYQLALQHQKYLQEIGANCQIIANQVNADIPFNNQYAGEFGFINAQVFFQFLAEAIGVKREYDVDNFKHLSKTVDKY